MDYYSYIRQFSSRGIDLQKIYEILYMTEEQINEIEKDEDFMDEIKRINIELQVRRLADYDEIVDDKGTPGDKLTRLKHTTKIFDKDVSEENGLGAIKIQVVPYEKKED